MKKVNYEKLNQEIDTLIRYNKIKYLIAKITKHYQEHQAEVDRKIQDNINRGLYDDIYYKGLEWLE